MSEVGSTGTKGAIYSDKRKEKSKVLSPHLKKDLEEGLEFKLLCEMCKGSAVWKIF